MKRIAALLFVGLALAGCNASGPAPQAAAPAPAVAVAPQDSHPGSGACATEIARYRAIQDNDLSMGHVAQSVYNQIKGEIEAADAQCSAGADQQARKMVIASKLKHGYPTGL